jgi:hypothetical protein
MYSITPGTSCQAPGLDACVRHRLASGPHLGHTQVHPRRGWQGVLTTIDTYRLTPYTGAARRALAQDRRMPPVPLGEDRVRAKPSQGERMRLPDCHTLICTLL